MDSVAGAIHTFPSVFLFQQPNYLPICALTGYWLTNGFLPFLYFSILDWGKKTPAFLIEGSVSPKEWLVFLFNSPVFWEICEM